MKDDTEGCEVLICGKWPQRANAVMSEDDYLNFYQRTCKDKAAETQHRGGAPSRNAQTVPILLVEREGSRATRVSIVICTT